MWGGRSNLNASQPNPHPTKTPQQATNAMAVRLGVHTRSHGLVSIQYVRQRLIHHFQVATARTFRSLKNLASMARVETSGSLVRSTLSSS